MWGWPPVLTHTYANPVVAVLLGWLLASEPLTMRVVLASVAILGAIVLIRRGERVASVEEEKKDAGTLTADGGLRAVRRVS